MNNLKKLPVDQFNGEQSSYASQPGYRQADFPYQIPKIDHAFIIQNYRRLRMRQRDQLAQLRIPDDLKRRIFNFRQDQNLKFQKPELVIFNHPFRGKTVMTRQEVQKELQKQRRNAQLGQEKQSRGQRVQQNLLNEMGLQSEHVSIQKAKMTRQKPSQNQEEYQKKPKLTSDQPQKKIAEQINKKQQDKMKGNLFFISKQPKKMESQSQRTQKMKKLIRQKQDSKQKSQTSRSKQKSSKKDKRTKDFKDMPIIGQEPVVVRDIKFDERRDEKLKNSLKTKGTTKGFYRPFGNQTQIRQFQKNGPSHEQDDYRLGSGQGFIKKRKDSKEYQFERNGNKSLSEISAIQSKDFQEDDLSNSQSLNNALFME